MSIAISITNPSQEVLWSNPTAACWAPLNMEIPKLVNSGQLVKGEEFFIRLELHKDTKYWENTSVRDRNLHDIVFDKLTEGWFKPEWFKEERSYRPRHKARTALVYSSQCPTWLLALSSSVYRMWADMPSFIHHWRELDRVQKAVKYNMHPWTQYAMVTNIANVGNSFDWLKKHVYIQETTNHMPIDGSMMDIGVIQLLDSYDADYFDKDKALKRIDEEVFTNKRLEWFGRDKYFTRQVSHVYSWMANESKKASILVNMAPKNPPPWGTVELKPYVFIPDFIEEVLKPDTL